ncbi:hypothetical protein F2Q70_00032004 [Brassica cretica]|uniref:NB-ARC domain-containing protein n=1 Tax=Brassica cretica TaxID=69181 RepID=A0A8S9FLN5_BRACR|nr:hypothetical protein F2Q70_00032004 [Brassica cretica]
MRWATKKNGRSPNKKHGPRPTNATPGLLWTRGKDAEQSTCKNLVHPPATCRPPQLSRPILAQPPTLSTVTTFRRNSEPTEPPRHRTSATPCLPVGEFNQKFEYIFFCVASSAPTFRNIVQNLLEHNGYEAPAYENDSQAVDGLRKLLEELKEDGPILLVLDDLWQGAESFLQKFQINMLDFKILVTSWFEFPSFGPTYHLKPLGDEDAKSLLSERASPGFYRIALKHEDRLQQILKHCYGFPLLIEVIGCQHIRNAGHWIQGWSEEEINIDNPPPFVLCRQPSLNVLDIGSFLEEKIHASSIIDMWMELYGESSTVHVKYLNDLAFLNLYKLFPIWRTGGLDISFGSSYMWIMWMLVSEKLLNVIPFGIHEHEDSFYNDFLVTRHSILRDLAQSKSEEHHERERLNLEIREDAFPDWCLEPISARLLSISADWMFSSTWVEMECPNVEALVLNLSSSSYALPNFITTMKKLKVVIIINDGHYPAKLTNLSCLSSLPNLKRIRFEKNSINSLDILLSPLCSLEKLSMFRCRFREVSYNIEDIAIPEALPSLQEIDIDHCYDLDELPAWVSEVVLLKKLSITNCGKLSVLPKALGNLSYELPESIERLGNLRLLDILIRMCPGCELPDPVSSSESSEVDCDEDQNEESESVI